MVRPICKEALLQRMKGHLLVSKEVAPPVILRYFVSPCPWCRAAPSFHGSFVPESGGTLVWYLYCGNHECSVRPQGRKVAIRKSQRFSLGKQAEKILGMVKAWSDTNPFEPSHKLEFRSDEMLEAIEAFRAGLERGEPGWHV